MKPEKRRRRDGSYSYRTEIYLNGQRVKSPTFGTVRELKEWAAKQRTQAATMGRRFSTDRPRTPFRIYGERWLEARVQGVDAAQSRSREKWIVSLINERFGDTPICEIERMDVQIWFNELAQRYSRSSLDSFRQLFSQILRSAEDDGYLPAGTPLKRGNIVLPPKDPDPDIVVLDYDQLEHLLDVVRQQFPEDYAFILTMAETGCRISEAAALRRANYSSLHRTIKFKRSLKKSGSYVEGTTTKTRRSRDVKINKRLQEALDDQLARHDSDLLFPQSNGRPIQLDNWRRRKWSAIRTAAGMPQNMTPHDLRHTMASQLLDAGVPDAVVAQMLGHTSLRMIHQVYGHAIDNRQEEALALREQRSRQLRSNG